jgi:hypothetical protein
MGLALVEFNDWITNLPIKPVKQKFSDPRNRMSEKVLNHPDE